MSDTYQSLVTGVATSLTPPSPAPQRLTIIRADQRDAPTAEDVAELARHKRAANTARAYDSARRDFAAFVVHNRLPSVTPQAIAGYLIALDNAGAKTATIEARRAALAYFYPEAGKDLAVKDTFDAIKRKRAAALTDPGIKGVRGNATTSKAALSLDDLKAVCAASPRTATETRDRLMILLGYWGAFRRSELVALNYEDVTLDKKGMLVRVVRGKTDQSGKGMTKPITANRNKKICPVEAWKAWIALRGISPGPVFVQTRRHNVILPGKRITAQVVALVVKRSVSAEELNPEAFAGHSLRSGFITTSRRAGVSDHTTKAVSGHKSELMLDRYDKRNEREALDELAGKFGDES